MDQCDLMQARPSAYQIFELEEAIRKTRRCSAYSFQGSVRLVVADLYNNIAFAGAAFEIHTLG